MLFNSYEFIFIFLPIALGGYFALRQFTSKSITLLWLTGASIVFYSVWDVWNLLVLIPSIVLNFWCGSSLSERAKSGRSTSLLLAAGIAFNLGLICYFKYIGFFALNLNAVFGTNFSVLQLALPLAISFFTFQEIAYLIDSSRGDTYGYRFKDYILMVTFFPHLIAGPIVNHRILMRQFMSATALRVDYETFSLGVSFFVIGLTKKILFADNMATQAGLLFDGVARGVSPSIADAWIGALAYTLQLYFDFSAYSDMAIGLGLMFGIRLPLNFNSPYKATSIIDFWRRWHMTLSAFLRDYLYYGLGGNRHGSARRYINLIVTMLLGGLWHGAGWTFVFWGAFHGVGLAICHFWRGTVGERFHPYRGSRLGISIAQAGTLLFVIFGWVLFRADSLSSAGAIMGTMVGLNGFDFTVNSERMLAVLLTLTSIAAMMAIALFAPNSQQWLNYDPDHPVEVSKSWNMGIAAHPAHGAALGCLFVIILTQMSAVQSFLYFQF